MDSPESQVMLREVVGIHHQSTCHRSNVVEVNHPETSLDIALRDRCGRIAQLARRFHVHIIVLQVLHPILITEPPHRQAGRVVLFCSVRGTGQTHADELQSQFRIFFHHLLADGSSYCGVQTTGESQHHCLEMAVAKITCRLTHHCLEYFLVIHSCMIFFCK